MTALFLVTVLATGQQAVVRARCLSCARDQAVAHAGSEGTMVWRDPAQSTVSLIDPTAKPGLIVKTGVAQ